MDKKARPNSHLDSSNLKIILGAIGFSSVIIGFFINRPLYPPLILEFVMSLVFSYQIFGGLKERRALLALDEEAYKQFGMLPPAEEEVSDDT